MACEYVLAERYRCTKVLSACEGLYRKLGFFTLPGNKPGGGETTGRTAAKKERATGGASWYVKPNPLVLVIRFEGRGLSLQLLVGLSYFEFADDGSAKR